VAPLGHEPIYEAPDDVYEAADNLASRRDNRTP